VPKVHEQEGCKFTIFVADHDPKHVHIEVGGAKLSLYLDEDANIKKTSPNLKAGDLRKAQRVTRENLSKLLSAWEQIHGR